MTNITIGSTTTAPVSLLALHRAALGAVAAWKASDLNARYAAYDAAWQVASAAGASYDEARTAAETAGQSVSNAHYALRDAATAACEALAGALSEAPWGAQPDGSFVTRRSRFVASLAYQSSLHAPNRRGVLAASEDHVNGLDAAEGPVLGSPRGLTLRTYAEAWRIRQDERAQRREAQALR